MTMSGMYVSPEQLMQDRADYARKGVARGRSLAAVEYQGGVALVAENASSIAAKGFRSLRSDRFRRRRSL